MSSFEEAEQMHDDGRAIALSTSSCDLTLAEVAEMKKFAESKSRIEELISQLKAIPLEDVIFADLTLTKGLDRVSDAWLDLDKRNRQLSAWQEQKGAIHHAVSSMETGDIERLRIMTKAAIQREMSAEDTDLVEIAIHTIFAFDTLVRLLASQERNLQLLTLRLDWEIKRRTCWKTYFGLRKDLNSFVALSSRFSSAAVAKDQDNGPEGRAPHTNKHAAFLQTEAAELARRCHNLIAVQVAGADTVLDEMMDQCKVPNAFLDEQERLEDLAEPIKNKLIIITRLSRQWQWADKADEISDLLSKLKIDPKAINSTTITPSTSISAVTDGSTTDPTLLDAQYKSKRSSSLLHPQHNVIEFPLVQQDGSDEVDVVNLSTSTDSSGPMTDSLSGTRVIPKRSSSDFSSGSSDPFQDNARLEKRSAAETEAANESSLLPLRTGANAACEKEGRSAEEDLSSQTHMKAREVMPKDRSNLSCAKSEDRGECSAPSYGHLSASPAPFVGVDEVGGQNEILGQEGNSAGNAAFGHTASPEPNLSIASPGRRVSLVSDDADPTRKTKAMNLEDVFAVPLSPNLTRRVVSANQHPRSLSKKASDIAKRRIVSERAVQPSSTSTRTKNLQAYAHLPVPSTPRLPPTPSDEYDQNGRRTPKLSMPKQPRLPQTPVGQYDWNGRRTPKTSTSTRPLPPKISSGGYDPDEMSRTPKSLTKTPAKIRARVHSTPSSSRRQGPNRYKANPKSKLDVAVAKIVNQMSIPVSITHAASVAARNVNTSTRSEAAGPEPSSRPSSSMSEYADESGRYWIGHPEPKLCFCRILRSRTVMVRVGGGWEELSQFVVKHYSHLAPAEDVSFAAASSLQNSPSPSAKRDQTQMSSLPWINSQTLLQANADSDKIEAHLTNVTPSRYSPEQLLCSTPSRRARAPSGALGDSSMSSLSPSQTTMTTANTSLSPEAMRTFWMRREKDPQARLHNTATSPVPARLRTTSNVR